eukprot:scaffold119575_cov63-Phaeocystis_antarctica.AAC.5
MHRYYFSSPDAHMLTLVRFDTTHQTILVHFTHVARYAVHPDTFSPFACLTDAPPRMVDDGPTRTEV